MPTHSVVGSDAESLTTLIAKVEDNGESVLQVLAAGDRWVVVTQPAVTASVASAPRGSKKTIER